MDVKYLCPECDIELDIDDNQSLITVDQSIINNEVREYPRYGYCSVCRTFYIIEDEFENES